MATQIPQPSDFSKVLEQAFSDLAAGKVADAEPVLRNALKLLPEETTVNNECMVKLGQICTERGDYSDAIRLNLRILDQLKRRFGENNQAVFESMEQLAALYENSGRFEEAAYMRKRANSIAEKLVASQLSVEQESLAQLPQKPEQSQSEQDDLGAEPAWLAEAFNDAAQAYGNAESANKTDKKTVDIVIEKPEQTAFFTRPEDEVEERPASSGIFERHDETKKREDSPSTGLQPQIHHSSSKDSKTDEKPKTNPLPKEDSSVNVGGISLRWRGKKERYKTDPHIDVSELEALIEKVSSGRMPVFRPEEYAPPEKHEDRKGKSENTNIHREELVVKNAPRDKTAGQIEESFFEKKAAVDEARPGFNFLFQLGKSLGLGNTRSKTTKALPSFGFGFLSGSGESPLKHQRDIPPTKLREAPQISLQESPVSIMFGHVAHWFVETLRELRDPNNLFRAILFAVIALAVILFACDRLIPRNPTASQVLTEIPLAYRSADGALQLRLVDSTTSQVKVMEKTSRPHYSLFLSDWRDFISLPLSALVQKQHWLMRSSGGLKSEEGPMLYYIGGPELQLADYMEHLADESSSYFAANSDYPSKIEDFIPARIAFKNPFSGKQELPYVQRLYYENDKEKKQLLTALTEGRPWRGEPTPHEGSIDCCSVTFKTNNGLDKLFLLRAYDRELQPLGGSSPGTSHYLLLENGERTSENTDKVPYQQWSFRPDVFWLIERGDNPASLFFLTYGMSILAGAIALTFLAIYKIAQPEKKSKIFIVLMIKLSIATAIILAFVRTIP